MIMKLLSALTMTAAMGCVACAPAPAAVTAVVPRVQDAFGAHTERAPQSKAASLRPRLMGRALDVAALAPAASIAALDDVLYAPTPSPELRGVALTDLASLHLEAGRPHAALAAARAGHDLAGRTFGPEATETIASLTGLGEALDAAGRPLEAEAALTFAAARGRQALGPEHPATREAERLLDERRGSGGRLWRRSLGRKLGAVS
jgi:hypothetical protein